MAYRPQFAMPNAPEGCTYQEFIYAFDASNCPALAALNLTPGQELLHVPLKLEDDADFIWLGVKVEGTTLGILLQTPWTDPLSDGYTPAELFAGNIVPTPLESSVFCPAGAVISLSVKNLA